MESFTTHPDKRLRQGIGTLNESSLHASLIKAFAEPGDRFEEVVEGYKIDILRDNLLIEIQTGNFTQIQKKLVKLAEKHPIRLIYPIAEQKWIVKLDRNGKQVSKRRSPKRGRVEDLFSELVRATRIILPNLSLWTAMIKLEEIWIDDGQGSWRRKKWSIQDRRLLEVTRTIQFDSRINFLPLLPQDLPALFTNKQLAGALKLSPSLASKMTYTLRKINILKVVGKEGNAHLHTIVESNGERG